MPTVYDAYSGSPGPSLPQSTSAGDDLLGLVQSLGSAIVSGAQDYVSAKSVGDQQDILNQSLSNSSDVLQRGYNERQGYTEAGIDELLNLLSAGLSDTTSQYRTAGFNYSDQSKRGVTQYAKDVGPVLDQLTRGMSYAGDMYGAGLDKAAGAATGTLQEGANEVKDAYAPYMETGQDALGYFAQVMGLDPNQLTPDQKIAIEDLTRNLTANLAASGLRGAGRAGVAAVGDSLARAKADMFKQNMTRRDDAARLLNTQGYNATGQVANTVEGIKRAIADLSYKTGTAKAGNAFDVNSNIADTAFRVGQDVAQKGYSTNQDVAKTQYGINKGTADATGQYYRDVGSLQSDRYSSRGNTALGKAQVESSTGLNKGSVDANAEAAQGKIFASALDRIGTALANSRSSSAKGV